MEHELKIALASYGRLTILNPLRGIIGHFVPRLIVEWSVEERTLRFRPSGTEGNKYYKGFIKLSPTACVHLIAPILRKAEYGKKMGNPDIVEVLGHTVTIKVKEQDGWYCAQF